MPSWEDVAGRYDEEKAAGRAAQREARAEEEREHAANLEAVAEADGLVQDFLRAARSVGNPGATQPVREVGWPFKRLRPAGAKRWVYDTGPLRGPLTTREDPELVVKVDGLWQFYVSDYTPDEPMSWFLRMGRRTEGLYYEREQYSSRRVADFVEHLQRDLVVLVRGHGIPTPS